VLEIFKESLHRIRHLYVTLNALN